MKQTPYSNFSEVGLATTSRGARLRALFVCLALLGGLILRLYHNSNLMRSPLYFSPQGGHRVFLDTARLIATGDLLPGSRPFTENSPLLPYLYATVIALFGENLLLLRLLNIAAEAFTILAIGLLARRLFGNTTAILAVLVYSFLGSAVYFSGELIYLPFVNAGICATLLLLTAKKNRIIGAGFLSAVFVGLMPTLAILVAFFAGTLFLLHSAKTRALLYFATTALGLLPLAVANYSNSGELVLLTTSAGHNFYFGHNPQAKAGYTLPTKLGGISLNQRGSTFDTMKDAASVLSARTLRDSEVSGFYLRLALRDAWQNPGRELRLLWQRLRAFLNNREMLTYGSYSYASHYSPVLVYLLPWGFVVALAVIGALSTAWDRSTALLLCPIFAALSTVIIFFFLSRFRFIAAPSVAIFAAWGLMQFARALSNRRFKWLLSNFVLLAVLVWEAQNDLFKDSGANEWNKEGAIYIKLGKTADATRALEKALAVEPNNANTAGNLKLLHQRSSKTSGETIAEQQIQN